MRYFAYVVLLTSFTGCTRLNGKLPQPDSACSKITSRAACEADPGCAVFTCTPDGFSFCYDPSEPVEGHLCPVDCSSLTNQASCEATPGCAVQACCGSFTSCYPSDAGPPACNEDCAPPACSTHTDEASCDADSNCAALDCCGGFAQCYERQGAPPPGCPFDCVATCSGYTDEVSCDAAAGCYSSFWPTGCTNAGCSYAFTQCAAGTPSCTPTQECTNALLSPNCVAPYAPEYGSDGCIDACVLASACQ